MLYIHENNLLNKIRTNYNGLRNELQNFYDAVYLPMRSRMMALTFDEEHRGDFDTATNICNAYYDGLVAFSKLHSIKSQSKFESTFLEEISSYLFKDKAEIVSGDFGVYNKKIYAGLKIDKNRHIEILHKDVDFCIGKKVKITIDNQSAVSAIIPIIAVEVKTYLDATMFGEVKSSSKAIRSASPNSKTYVLMGYKCLADEHIIAARQDSALTEIFVLRKDAQSPMDSETIYQYWSEISNALSVLAQEDTIQTPGRLINP